MSEGIISTSVMVSCVREAGVKRGVWRAQVFDPVTVTIRQENVKECVPGKTTFGEKKGFFLLHPLVNSTGCQSDVDCRALPAFGKCHHCAADFK